ncbi:MAG: hypothetical protein KDE26_19040, partial [Bacteroidetes bacterium]|nr:hypothetical protein [Bacteroidota bacterium]
MTYFYYQSLTREFELIKERTTLFPDHQLSSSALKKLISSSLRTILNRYLPQNVRVGHGHIISGNHISEEMDLLFYRSESRLWYQENQFVVANANDVSGIASVFPKVEDLHQLSTFMAHLAHVAGKTFEGISHDPRSFFDSPGDKNQQQNIFTGMLVLDYEGQDSDQAILDELSSVSRKDSLRIIHYLTPGVNRFFAHQGNTQGWESYYFPESDHTGLTCFIGNILEHFSGSQASPFPQWLNEKRLTNGSTYPKSDFPGLKTNMNGYHSHQESPENNSQNDLNHRISVPSSESSVLVSEPIAKVEEFIEKPEEEEVKMEESVVEVEEIPEEEPEMETQTEAAFTPTIELVEVKSVGEQTETVDSDEITSQEEEVEKVEDKTSDDTESLVEVPEETVEEDQVETEEKVETTEEVVEEDEINEPDEVTEEEQNTLQTEEAVVDEIREEETQEEEQVEQEETVDSEEDIDTGSIDQEEILAEEEATSQDEEDQDEPEDQSAKSSPSLVIP